MKVEKKTQLVCLSVFLWIEDENKGEKLLQFNYHYFEFAKLLKTQNFPPKNETRCKKKEEKYPEVNFPIHGMNRDTDSRERKLKLKNERERKWRKIELRGRFQRENAKGKQELNIRDQRERESYLVCWFDWDRLGFGNRARDRDGDERKATRNGERMKRRGACVVLFNCWDSGRVRCCKPFLIQASRVAFFFLPFLCFFFPIAVVFIFFWV